MIHSWTSTKESKHIMLRTDYQYNVCSITPTSKIYTTFIFEYDFIF